MRPLNASASPLPQAVSIPVMSSEPSTAIAEILARKFLRPGDLFRSEFPLLGRAGRMNDYSRGENHYDETCDFRELADLGYRTPASCRRMLQRRFARRIQL